MRGSALKKPGRVAIIPEGGFVIGTGHRELNPFTVPVEEMHWRCEPRSAHTTDESVSGRAFL